MGSYSQMAKIGEENTHYNLYSEGGLWKRRDYNRAMSAFLSCVQELGEYASRRDPSIHMPYEIKETKIGGNSVLSHSNDLDEWTSALKYILTNLKWLIAWSAKRT